MTKYTKLDADRAVAAREQFLRDFPHIRRGIARDRVLAGHGYANLEVFDSGAMKDLEIATHIVARLPGKDRLGRYVRCHELARVVSLHLPKTWHVLDGQVGPVQHSWLQDPMTFTVLDVYVPTRLPQVQLVDVGIHFQRDLYIESEKRRDIRWAVVRWLELKLQQGQ